MSWIIFGIGILFHAIFSGVIYGREKNAITFKMIRDAAEVSLYSEFFSLFFFFCATMGGQHMNPFKIIGLLLLFYPLDFLVTFLFVKTWPNIIYKVIKYTSVILIIVSWLGKEK